MRKYRVLGLACVSAAFVIGAAPVAAYQSGDWIVRGGVATVAPTKDYSEVADGAFELRVDRETGIAVSFSYLLTDALSVNVLAATPFKHDIEARGVGTIGSTYHLPPTVTLSYFPLAGSGSEFQPYVGAGLNYTHFWEEKLNDSGKTATGASDLSLDSSVGLAAHAGLDYRIDDQWGLGAEIYYINIETDASLDGNDIGTVKIDPLVYRVSLIRRF